MLYIYVMIYIYIYIYVHTYIYISICKYIHLCVYIMHAQTHTHIYIYIYRVFTKLGHIGKKRSNIKHFIVNLYCIILIIVLFLLIFIVLWTNVPKLRVTKFHSIKFAKIL